MVVLLPPGGGTNLSINRTCSGNPAQAGHFKRWRASMKSTLIAACIVIGSAVSEASDADSVCDSPKEGSTLQMSCALQTTENKVDAELNFEYQRVLDHWKSESFKRERLALIKAQRSWLDYRDATCRLEQEVFGGVASISGRECRVRTTAERAEYLRQFLPR